MKKEKSVESLQEYKKRVMDSKSSSFCGAKWLTSSIWLGSGQTSSCHLPPAHAVEASVLQTDPSALHNTEQKRKARAQMQKGERPAECESCWKIEDLGPHLISDRVFKTKQFREEELQKVFNDNPKENPTLVHLEIAFDRVCQLMCSYCSSALSSTWSQEIKRNGAFQNLQSDAAPQFQRDADSDFPFLQGNNPYMAAFWRWWPQLRESLRVLRVTGGEPLLSPDFWKLIEKIETEKMQKPNFVLAVNSNFVVKDELIAKFIQKSHRIPKMRLFTSAEAYGTQAEYIRKGFKYEVWKNNVIQAGYHANLDGIYLMMTINALCLFSLVDFLDDMMQVKSLFAPGFLTLSLNILRFPSFQSPLVLPQRLKNQFSEKLKVWCENNFSSPYLRSFEKESLLRLVHYLLDADTPYASASPRSVLKADFQSFYAQYDQRCGFDIRQTFGSELTKWFDQNEEAT